MDGKAVAIIDKTTCKGCGGCVPVCPVKAIDLEGYTDAQIRAMIDGMLSAPRQRRDRGGAGMSTDRAPERSAPTGRYARSSATSTSCGVAS